MQKEQCLGMIKEFRPNLSNAKACKLLNCSRTSKYYEKRMPAKDLVIEQLISNVVGVSRIGRQKVIVKVQRKHPEIGASRIRRVYENRGFSLFKRMKNKRLNNPANPISVPLAANEEWAMDFMSDSLSSGRKLRTLNVVDQYNRKCLSIEAYYSISTYRVIEILEKAIEKHLKPIGMVERVSGIIKNDTILKTKYSSHTEMSNDLLRFLRFYNLYRRHGSLRRELKIKTPYNALEKWFELKPEIFKQNLLDFENKLLKLQVIEIDFHQQFCETRQVIMQKMHEYKSS